MSIGQTQSGSIVNTQGVRAYIHEDQSPVYNATNLIGFRYPSPDLAEKVNQWLHYDPKAQEQLDGGSGTDAAESAWAKQPFVGLNQFYYPMGGQRFACFRGLVSGEEYDQLSTRFLFGVRKYCWFHIERIDNGTVASPRGTLLKSGVNLPRISTPMRILQPIRCSAIAGEEALWLVTLVDERWAWQRVRMAGDFNALTFPASTLSALQLNPSSTVSIPTAAVDSGACGCGSALANSGCEADLSGVTFDLPDSPVVPAGGFGAGSAADMILAHQGKVLVRSWAGNYTAVKLSTANADALANHDANSLYTFMGGRVFTVGSCAIPPEAYEFLPRRFIYRTGTANYENGVAVAPTGVTNTYGKRFARQSIEFGIEDLFNTPFSTIGATEAAKLYHTATMTDTILWLTTTSPDQADIDDVADNNDLVRDVALTSAANYCEALLSPVDASYRGVAGWYPDGATDLLFDLNGPTPTTRAMRRPALYARQEFYRKLAEIEVDSGGGGSSSGCCTPCSTFCHAVLVPDGDGTPTTMYMRQDANGCLTLTLDPCDTPATDCAECLLGQSFGVEATGLSAIATTCDDAYSDPALGGTFLALPGPGGPCDPYLVNTPGTTLDLYSPNVTQATVPCASGSLDLYVACSNTGAPDDCSVDPGTVYCWYHYVPDVGSPVAVQLTLVTKSCSPFFLEFVGDNGERIIWS